MKKQTEGNKKKNTFILCNIDIILKNSVERLLEIELQVNSYIFYIFMQKALKKETTGRRLCYCPKLLLQSRFVSMSAVLMLLPPSFLKDFKMQIYICIKFNLRKKLKLQKNLSQNRENFNFVFWTLIFNAFLAFKKNRKRRTYFNGCDWI